MVRLTGMASEDSSPVGEEPGERTVEPLSSGGTRGRPACIGDVDELLTTGKSRTTNRPRDPRVTLSEDTSTADGSAQPQSTHTKKVWKLHGYQKGMKATWLRLRLDLCLIK